MLSVGVDIENISRFDKLPEKFFLRVFTKNELEYCNSKKNSSASFCARFCAKEAVFKALSSIYDKPVPFNKIEILNRQNGVPYVNILIDELKKYNYSLSLSHEKEKAIAFVVVS